MRHRADLSPVRQKVEIRAAMGSGTRVIERVHQQRLHEERIKFGPTGGPSVGAGHALNWSTVVNQVALIGGHDPIEGKWTAKFLEGVI